MLVSKQGTRVFAPFLIDGVQHPPNIEQLWSDKQLAAIGLTRVPEPTPEPEPPYVPQVISDRQFFQALAMQGLVTKDEALAAVKTGEVPQLMRALIDKMPDAESKFAADMLLSGATEFRRDHALVAVFAASQGFDDAMTDEFFRTASQL